MRPHLAQRRAATTVELAFVLPACVLFLFGIFEYGRFVFANQVMENAAREGARYAVAHTYDKNTDDVLAEINRKMAGVQNNLGGYTVTLQAIVLRPQVGQTAGQVLPSWTDASPTDGISVQIEGDYSPILASFLGMPASIHLRSRSVMYSEGN